MNHMKFSKSNRKDIFFTLLFAFLLTSCVLVVINSSFAQSFLNSATVTTSSSSGQSSETNDPDCPDDASAYANSTGGTVPFGAALYNYNTEGTKAQIASVQDTFRKMKYNDKFGCMIKIMDIFDVIHKILTGSLSLLGVIILGVLNAIIGKICEYIIVGINNLLTMACLPVPNLGLSLTMPSLQRQTCDGISLANFMPVTGGPVGLGSNMLPGGMNPMSIIPPRQPKIYETFIGVKP